MTPGDTRYIALTTYRRDGRPVTTPVWAAPLNGNLYVVTARSTGKVRRLRATDRVRFAPSNMNGRRILGAWHEGSGRVVEDEQRRGEALAALQRKVRVANVPRDADQPVARVGSRACGAGADAGLTWQVDSDQKRREL
jgi:PPOX class probable F420-dependent enzyme